MSNGILTNIFRKYRGLSRDSGGTRELSSGILSDRIREHAICMTENLFEHGNLVEVGCGEGLFLDALDQPGSKIILCGIEKETLMIERAQIRFREKDSVAKLVMGVGNRLPFRKESVDAVICINTFYNQPSFLNIVEILEEMARICRPGGYIIFDIRNSYNLCIYLAYRYVKSYDPTWETLPLHTHSIFKIIKTLKKLRLKIIKIRGVFFPFWFLAPAIIFVSQKVKA